MGVACYVELTGVGPFEGATVRVDSAGRITVFTGVTSQGQGLETTLAQVAADELGVTPDDVTVVNGDTAGIAQGIGTFASRAAVVGGTAVALAARDLRAKAAPSRRPRRSAIAEDEVEQSRARVRAAGRPEHRVDLARLASVAAARHRGPRASSPASRSRATSSRPTSTYSSGAHVAPVEVDADVGPGEPCSTTGSATTADGSSIR